MPDISYLWDAVYGNEVLKTKLKNDISQHKLSHAYIIEGPAYSGKLTLARTIAAAMCRDVNDVKKITSAACPDVLELTLPEKKKSIGVEAVREIKLSVYIKPNDLDFKLYIIRHAECLTVQAQNALLKLIEEPPKQVYFLLLCENVTALLATIRSRAPVFRMQVFSAEELKALLLEHSQDAVKINRRDPGLLDLIVRSSGGAYGRALLKIVEEENDVPDAVTDAVKLLEALASSQSAFLMTRIQKMAPEREAFRQTLEKLRLLVRDILAYRTAGERCELIFDDPEAVKTLAEQYSLDRLLSVHDVLWQTEKELSQNPNIQNLKTQLYSKLGNC